MTRRTHFLFLALSVIAAVSLSWFYGFVAMLLGATWAFFIGKMAEAQGAEKVSHR